MRIQFQFDFTKAIATMAWLIDRLGTLEKVRLTKLVYIADREHFLAHGRPITGDDLYAMPFGPVPSRCLQILNGDIDPEKTFKILDVHNNDVTLAGVPELACLTEDERRVLDQVIARYGGMRPWALVRLTHDFPEYARHYVADTATKIPYESILADHGDDRHYRLGRPVVTPQMAAAMPRPYSNNDEDL